MVSPKAAAAAMAQSTCFFLFFGGEGLSLSARQHSEGLGSWAGLQAGGAGRTGAENARMQHTGGCGGWPYFLFVLGGGRSSAPRRAAALTPGRKGQPGRLKRTSDLRCNYY
jgi:hypothetical protein